MTERKITMLHDPFGSTTEAPFHFSTMPRQGEGLNYQPLELTDAVVSEIAHDVKLDGDVICHTVHIHLEQKP